MLVVRRSDPERGYLIVPNAVLRDRRLSYRARGVLVELLSHETGWHASADRMSREGKKAGTACEGRQAIEKAMGELIAAGYITRAKGQNEKGQWVTTLTVYDTPGHVLAAAHETEPAEPGDPFEAGVGETPPGDVALTHRLLNDWQSVFQQSMNRDSVTQPSVFQEPSRSTPEKTFGEDQEEEQLELPRQRDFDEPAVETPPRARRSSAVDRLIRAMPADVVAQAVEQFRQEDPSAYDQQRQTAEDADGDDSQIPVDRLTLMHAAAHYSALHQIPTWMTAAISAISP
ncbi:hypothetical protein [Stackebrandtia soli]|uniref:hypothetical protein n=1 Tax=Stackebrandtia soli TaxID=1892856 RepID=UPI0039E7E203